MERKIKFKKFLRCPNLKKNTHIKILGPDLTSALVCDLYDLS